MKLEFFFTTAKNFFFIVLIGVGAVTFCNGSRAAPVKAKVLTDSTSHQCPIATSPCPVTFSQLLSSPQQFNDRLVQVEGFYVLSFETSALYESRDALAENRKNAIWIDVAVPNNAHLKNVTATGTFRHGPAGHMSEYIGAIENAQLFIHPD